MWKQLLNFILGQVSIHDAIRAVNKKIDEWSHKTENKWDDYLVDEYIEGIENLMNNGVIPDHIQIKIADALQSIASKKLRRR